MSPLPSLPDFAPLVGERFELRIDADAAGTALVAELVEAQPLAGAPFQGRQPFSLLLRGPPSPLLPQRIYRLAHERLPALDVFLVPIAADAGGVRYEAVFG